MNIVAVAACPTGVAHTYMAKKALEDAAKQLGHQIKVEAQGALGIENEITKSEVEAADVVILAIEVEIAKAYRFKNKPKVNLPINTVIKSPIKVLEKIEAKMKSQVDQ